MHYTYIGTGIKSPIILVMSEGVSSKIFVPVTRPTLGGTVPLFDAQRS